MGTESSLNGKQNEEILQTEYVNTTYDKEYNIDINNNYDIKIMNKNSKNKNLNFGKRNQIVDNKKNITDIFFHNSGSKNIEKKKVNQNNKKKKEREIIYRNNRNPINKVENNNINFDYFKCISCPMCILIEINHKNNHVKIKCENGHNNEMNIDSFISIYQLFKYSCDKCKKELISKYYYCYKCKELFCETCMNKAANNEINKGHIFLNEANINFICDIHKKRFVNFCINCQKNCCKKCSAEHSSHELLLIKNEIRDDNYILQIDNMLDKEKEIIDNIEVKYPQSIFKNTNQNLLKIFNRLISLRKKEYQLKNKILKIYKDCISKINDNINENKLDTNLNFSNLSINSIRDNPNNFLMNYYFLKNVNELENEVLSCEKDFFDFSEDNKFYNDFLELKNYLLNYKNNIVPPEKNLENFSKIYTIHKKPNFIFPLKDGNFIVTYDTKIIFYDGLSGDELLILDEEIFDYTYKIIRLPDDTLLFFGDFLNQIKIDENGSIKVIFTGSHIEILKEVILDENNLVFIDKLTQKLKILTNKDINWHKEIFYENYDNNSEEKNDLNISMSIDLKNATKRNDKFNENKLNNTFMTMNECQDAKELFMNSIKNMRENKKKKVNEIMKNANNKNYQIKTFDIISIDENNFISLQEKKFLDKETCLRIFNYDKNNFNLKDIIYLEEPPLKKNDVLYLIDDEKENKIKHSYLGYGSNNKKYFIIYDLDKKTTVSKINLEFFFYKFNGNLLFYYNQNELFQYAFNEDEFIFISKLPFNNNIYSINFLKDFSLVLDDKKYAYIYSNQKIKENI